MLKIFLRLATLVSILSTFLFAFPAFAQSTAASNCELNGQPVPCGELWHDAKPYFFIIGMASLLAFAFVIAAFIFWIKMIIHAAEHPIEHKTAWIIILIFTHFIGALIYYFIVKKPMDKMSPAKI